MNTIAIIGLIACIITTTYTSIGLSTQVWMNFKSGSSEGLSFLMLFLMFLTFSSWVVYGIYKEDLYILIPNIIGALFALSLNLQKILSRK